MRTLTTTPAADGFRMPGEFEPHTGCWMLWPERTDVWRSGAKPAQRAYAAVANAISQFEPVTMGVSARQYTNARHRLNPAIRLIELSYNDAWIRDTGPTFVIDPTGQVRGVDWQFNAYGGLEEGIYFPWHLDQQIAQKVLEIEWADRYQAPLTIEGGALAADGQGTLITTEQCVLNPNRNPTLSRTEVESLFQQYLGVKTIIWLGRGLAEDETDGHIDGVCCFVRPGVVLLSWTDDPANPSYEALHDAWERLRQATDAQGRSLEIHKLPLSDPITIAEADMADIDFSKDALERPGGYETEGSYVNFYIANGGVVLPTYGTPSDQVAQQIVADLFPERKVVGVPCQEILVGGGEVHCITQQVPAGQKGGAVA